MKPAPVTTPSNRELWEAALAKGGDDLERKAQTLRRFPADVGKYIEGAHQAIMVGPAPKDPEDPKNSIRYVATRTPASSLREFILGKAHTNVIAANNAILRFMLQEYPKIMRRSEDKWLCDKDLKPEGVEIAYFIDEAGCLGVAIEDIPVLLRVKKVDFDAEEDTEHKN